MAPIPYRTKLRSDYPNASHADRKSETSSASKHRYGNLNHEGRQAGSIGFDDDLEDTTDVDYIEGRKDFSQLARNSDKLYTIRDVIKEQPDYVQIHPDEHPIAARFVLNVSESEVKEQKDWPANIKARAKEEKEEAEKKEKDGGSDNDSQPSLTSDSTADSSEDDEEPHKLGDKSDTDAKDQEYRRNRHDKDGHRAHSAHPQHDEPDEESTLSSQEQHFLHHLQKESEHMSSLKAEDGHGKSPLWDYDHRVADIDEKDQNTPDNWIPRSLDLIRQTGNHPLNAEPGLTELHKAGLITPNKLHYVRNHGPVPRLAFETHNLHVYSEVDGVLGSSRSKGSQEDTKNDFPNDHLFTMQALSELEWINISISMACDGNRRGELNKIKRSKGFDWGCGAVSNAYWKGPTVLSVLRAAGFTANTIPDKQLYIHFEGADQLSEGKYSTSFPLDYVMTPENDVMLAQFMNDVPLAPDHGYPLRLIIPGFVGGRMVKWLEKIWISDKPSENYYHIWDNRVLPSFVTEKDGPFAETMFRHPDTACMEQNLNSAITRPAHDEDLTLNAEALQSGSTYRIEGYAYDGGGHMVQKVEISLDEGATWLYAYRRFPDKAVRHGRKFWTWCHWYCEVEFIALLSAKEVRVRAWNVFKNTQPETPTWNLMGMMNNCVYRIKQSIENVPVAKDDKKQKTILTFKHPIDPVKDHGWMKPSTEIKLAAAKQSAGAPEKQFTASEIQKHNKKDDCWLVINNTVYDTTSVLDWHPGGAHAILNQAGRTSYEVSEQYNSIHDDFANHKLQECAIGTVTDKVKKKMKQEAEDSAAEIAAQSNSSGDQVLKKHAWTAVKLLRKKELDRDTRLCTFAFAKKTQKLNLATGKHVLIGFHFEDKIVFRAYTPTRPVLPEEEDGTFDVIIKIYFPNEQNPGGTIGNILDTIHIGESVDIKGPTGEIEYNGNGEFQIEKNTLTFKTLNLVGGGSGVTPHYQLIHRILKTKEDNTKIIFFYCNSSEKDILMRDELETLEKENKDSFKLIHILSHPSDEWKGEKGHIDGKILEKYCVKESAGTFLCGPPAMINAAHDALTKLGFKDEKSLFAF